VKFNKPQIPFISCVSGKWITAEDAMDPAYWTRHLREPVRFAAGLTTLFKEPEPVFLQTSPGKGLILFVTQHPDRKEDTLALSMVKHRNEQTPDVYHTLTQIGRLWLNGFPIDWRKFYPHQEPHRIALPTYPFESKHYPLPKDLLKIGNREESEERSSNKFKLIRQTDMANWFYIPVWEESPLLSPTNRLPGFFNWLVFMDELGIGIRLVNELRGIARDVVTVTMGEAYVKIDENSYSLSPGQPGDYGRLFHELHKSAKIPHNIVHLWSVSENKVSRMCGESLEEFDRAQELGFFSLLNIARAVGEENIPGEIHINVISNNIQSVTGEEEIHPEKACMRGAVKIIPLEYDNIYCALIDFLLTGPGDTGNDERVRQLMRELTTTGETGSPDKMIALRGRRRWCERMKPVNLGNMGQGQVEQRLKEKGVYLITGGFGGMGFTIAGYLAQFFQAKVILIGRSFFPARENWAEWLESHPGDDAISKKIQKIQQWEEAGAEIMVHRADVADLERMISVIKDVHMRFGPINGVLHTAGLGDYAGLIRDRTHRMTKEVMAPKVKGAWVLDKVLAEDRLDFLVLFSSIGNIIYRVKFAQVGYNAANEYLEAFANYKTRKDGTYTVTINWCDWLEVGMSIEATNQKYQKRWEFKTRGGTGAIDYKAAIHGGITPAQGVEILTRIVNNPFSLERVTVSMYELDGMMQALRILGEKDSTPFAEIEKLVAPGKRQPRPPLSVPYVSPASPLEHSLSAIWSNYFGIEPIGVEDDFFELGGDSLKAMLMIQKIHKELGVRIPLAEFFKNPTVKGQAGYIARSEKKIYDSIPLVEKKEYYPQSSAQRRIYVIHRMEENSIRYNITHAVTIEGEIDESRFQGIFARIIKRHESLRTSFLMINDEAVQIVHEEAEFEIGYYKDYTDFQKSSFNLSHAPLLRVALLKIAEKKHLLLLDIHHIIADGASIDILQDEIISIYNGEELPPLPVNYKDYAGWQNREKNSQRIHEQGKYWQEVFAGEIPFLNLPTDYKRPVLQSFDGSRLNFEISIDMTAKLKALALATGATMYMVVLAVYTIFLAKISGQDDIVIGTPASGRSHTDLEKIIGMFVNTLTLRNYPSGEKEFLHYLSEIKDSTVKAFENQDYQYEDLVDQVVKDRDISRNPLFDTMFVMQQNTVVREPDIPGLKIKPYEHENTTSKFDLTLEGKEDNERLLFWFEYSTKLFKHETIGRFIAYFINIIKGVVENSREKISDFEIITEAEKKLVLFDFNDTGIAYPMGKTIHQLFEEQVEQTPDHIALVGADLRVCPSRNACNVGNVNLTYRQLNEQSDRLAGLFIEKGILPDNIIGIMMERSVEMIIGIMGILKSGGAYLPIDPEFPKDRIDYMLKDSNAAILLTDNCQLTIVNSQLSMSEHRASFHHSNMAYVIYTSGSTGNPKGVMIDHASVVNLLFVMQDNYPFTSSDTYLVKTSYVFDVSVTELFGWFMGGGRAAVLEKDGHKDPRAIVDSIEKNKVSYINFVPSMFNSFIEYMAGEKKRRLAGLKYIFLAGEELLPGLVEKFRDLNTGITLENIYGPTESTVYSCKYSLSGWNGIGDIPIGQPLANTKLYILNKYHYLQPVGIAGELCISGPGLARGYLNNPELTADRFYRSYRSYMTYIFYKTGDLTRWQPDGNIEFLGRVDHQVKIRGFRIELGEIENRLLNYPGIKEVVVLAHEEETGDKYLCAYFVSAREHERTELQEYLSMTLPDYMIPAYFTSLEKIPLTPNGKIDRRALPKPELKAGESYTAPRNEIETKLLGLWSGVLGRDALHASQLQASIGMDDNFFRLGGHSLKATLLAAKIHKVFNVKISLLEIFKNPTISGLSNYIGNTAVEKYTGIAPVEQKEYYILSSAERRLHFLQQMDKDGTAYNIPVAWILEGVLDRKKLADTFVQLVKRHESFRTSFVIIGEEPM
ncbi:MAG TPA: amino acid adenylation domain-containing protein, partial [Candidatus Deferrimicrobium sp.]|nr:amino acid adenylation domain-containing protein [Candidatus Deferrimicrobium sp.]